ncbi:hypothetical protein C1J02_17105 [Sulfitobacter sp. SK011]|nr:hypothetical protein C1J02_17105 [Sulfitobacter sp. SK011]
MAMCRKAKAAQMVMDAHSHPGPLRRLCREARSRFIVHGHRLTSLYRRGIRPLNSFIFLKIHKEHHLRRVQVFVYLWNNEAEAIA